MNEQWYYEQHGVPHGPVAREHLEHLVSTGAIDPACLVWREGLTEWLTADRAGLGDADAPQTPPVPPPLPAAPPRVAAPPQAVVSLLAPPVMSVAARAPHRAAPPMTNWPLVLGGGAAALVVAVVVGWLANSLLNPPPGAPGAIAASKPPLPAAPTSEANPRLQSRPNAERPPAPPTASSPAPVPATAVPATTDRPTAALPAPLPVPVEPVPVVSSPPISATATPPPTPALPTQPPLAASTPPPKPAPGPQTLYQEIDVRRAPKFTILGTETAQDLHYQMLSELRVGAADDKGLRKIEQYVHGTKLLKADELSQGMFEQSLRDLVGWQFTFQVNRRGDITLWKGGPPAGRKAARVERGAEVGFMVTSVMDEDGWKEMAQLSFFVPEEQTSGSQSWVRKMSHDFGALGSWSGETHFTPKEKQSGMLQVDYTHHMTYKPPGKDVGALPFTVHSAIFKPEIASGTFLYDTEAGRVQQLQERFWVKGELSTELLGQAATVGVEEDQLITVRILEQNPWEQ